MENKAPHKESPALVTPMPGIHPAVSEEAVRHHARTGGSTFNPRTGENMFGRNEWAVGAVPEASHVSDRAPQAADHHAFALQHADLLARHQNAHIGTYHDPRTGLHHIEIVALTPHRQSAIDLASSLGENHVHNIGTHETVDTGAQRPEFISHSPDERFSLLHHSAPVKHPYHGVHYSDADMDTIDGHRRGVAGESGSAGAEAGRLRLGTLTGMGPDAPAGFYTYDAGTLPHPAMQARAHAHAVHGNFSFGSTQSPEFQQAHQTAMTHALTRGADPKTAHGLGINAGEHALMAAGYSGYSSPREPHSRFIFGSHTLDKHEYEPPVNGKVE